MKRPSFQFYPGDWRRDSALQSCSIAARGLWVELMCVMHDCEPYGHLVIGGKAMQPAQLARLVGLSGKECGTLLAELEEAGVLSRTESGVIYSRRMVRDEATRNARAEGGKAGASHGVKGASHGAKGGRPKKDKGGSETPLETPLEVLPEPPPSSSSSSSSSSSDSSLRSESREPRARLPGDAPPPTLAGQACAAMKRAGLQRVNPSDPRLLELLSQGVTPAQLGDLAVELCAGRPEPPGMAYVVATMAGRLRDAGHRADPALQGRGPPRPRRSPSHESFLALTGQLPRPESAEVIDVEPSPARRLG